MCVWYLPSNITVTLCLLPGHSPLQLISIHPIFPIILEPLLYLKFQISC